MTAVPGQQTSHKPAALKRLLLETISLQSSRGRLTAFALLTTTIFFSHYHWLDHLSLWGDLGIKHAPSIGLTRAYWLLIHGQPAAAWHRNWLIYAVLLIGIPLLTKDCLRLFRRRSNPSPQSQFVL